MALTVLRVHVTNIYSKLERMSLCQNITFMTLPSPLARPENPRFIPDQFGFTCDFVNNKIYRSNRTLIARNVILYSRIVAELIEMIKALGNVYLRSNDVSVIFP